MTDIFPKNFFLLISCKRLRIHTIVAFSFVRTFARGFRPCFRQDGRSRCDIFVQASLRLFPWRHLNRLHHCVHRKQYGNTPVKFHQADTLSRAFKLLHSYGLHIGIFRADCSSCSDEIIRTVDGNCRILYIRAIHSASMYSRIQDIREWRRVEMGSQETEVASVMSTQFMEDSR